MSAAELEEQLASRGGLKVKFPAGWVLEGGSGMRLGTARLPRVDGDSEDGEMSIIPAFGSVDANVARWEGQFDGSPTQRRDPTMPHRVGTSNSPHLKFELKCTWT